MPLEAGQGILSEAHHESKVTSKGPDYGKNGVPIALDSVLDGILVKYDGQWEVVQLLLEYSSFWSVAVEHERVRVEIDCVCVELLC